MTNNTEKKQLEYFILDKNIEKLEDKLSEFNIFDAIGGIRSELRHSNILAFLLNPAEAHGLGDYFLKKVLKTILSNSDDVSDISLIEIDINDFNGVEVYREKNNIDILLVSTHNNLVVVIENKVDSAESKGQLLKYSDRVKKDYEKFNKLYVFLTPDGIEATERNWITFSYFDVSNILKSTLMKFESRISEDIRILLKNYLEIIKRHIMTNGEIANLCQEIYKKHKHAVDLIIEHKPDKQAEIRDYLLNKIGEEKKYIEKDDCVKSYIRFSPVAWKDLDIQKEGHGWTSTKKLLLFEFRNTVNGLSLHLVVGPTENKDIRNQIIESIRENRNNDINYNPIRNTPKFTSIYKNDIVTESILKGEIELIYKEIDEKWKSFIGKDFRKIVEDIKNHVDKSKC